MKSEDEEPNEGLEQEIDLSELLGGGAQVWQPGEFAYYGPKSRTVALIGDVDESSAGALISQLLELDKDPGPILLNINTAGGSAIDGMAIYDVIRTIESPVLGMVTGGCMSAGLLVLAACDYRSALPNSVFFYHQPILCMPPISSTVEMRSTSGYYQVLQERYDSLLRERCKIPEKVWKEKFDGKTSKYFGTKEAKSIGLIDHVPPYPKKKFKPEVSNG